MVDCCHALQEKEDEEHANEVNEPNCKAREENHAQQTSEAADEADQEEAIYEEGVANQTSPQAESYATRCATDGVVIKQRRRNF